MSAGFHWFVIIGTLGSFAAFFLILWMNRKVSNPGESTGHNYDGIEELDNPMPSWWFWGFVLSIVWSVAYLIYYPGLGNFAGIGGWTQEGQLARQQALAEERYGPIFAQYRDIPVEELMHNSAAMRMGQRLFANACAQCHGSAGTGSEGFPNLTDAQWQWGGEAEQIKTSINNGRNAVMPAWAAMLDASAISEVTEYILHLSGRQVDTELADAGAAHYRMYCGGCHGADGGGQVMMGAPDLSNDVWLYGNTRARIEDVVRNGRQGQMPSFQNRLGEDRVHILSAYVKRLAQNQEQGL